MAIRERKRTARLAAAMGGLTLAVLPLVSGCETDDPCARRTAACVEVTLVGKRDDGNGGPIAYRGLEVKIFAPNMSGPQSGVMDKCDTKHLYGSELGPVGASLASVSVPDLLAHDTFSPAVQGKLSFQLPDGFNALADMPPADSIDPIPDTGDKIMKLKALRDSDPRAMRILITQAGLQKSAWDSRCDEALFSDDEWTMKQYYRVGQNKSVTVIANLEGAQTSPP
jgi:hypothetical protein